MRGFLAVLKKEAVQMIRDKGSLRFALMIPAFQLALFGFIDMNESHELFDMSDAPFTEKPVAADTDASGAARTRLTAVLAELNPAGGKTDGAGGGKGKAAKQERKKKKAAEAN